MANIKTERYFVDYSESVQGYIVFDRTQVVPENKHGLAVIWGTASSDRDYVQEMCDSLNKKNTPNIQ